MQAARRALLARAAALAECSTSGSSTSLTPPLAAGFAKKAGGGDERGSDTKIQKLLKVLEPVEMPKEPMSAEEQAEAARRHKEYSRLKMQQHREWQTDLSTKLQLKVAAISALPEGPLRAAALVEDTALFPTNRLMWTETPPIEEKAAVRVAAAANDGKRRIGTKRR